MAEEMQMHLEMEAARQRADGVDEAAATYGAQKNFGGIEQTKERCRDERGIPWLERIIRDARFALRSLRRTPGFTATAVLTLALGIGACTAIFSIVDGVLLRPLAFRAPEQLVWLRENLPAYSRDPLPVNSRHFLAWRERTKTLAGVSLIYSSTVVMTGKGEPEVLRVANVSSNLFELLGTPPAFGRGFAPEEETVGRNNVVVLGDAFWRRDFAADPAVVGRSLLLDGAPHTVIGIMPASFRLTQAKSGLAGLSGTASPDLFRPKVITPAEQQQTFGSYNYGAIARLAPGGTLAQAESELNAIAAQFVVEMGEPKLVLRSQLTPLRDAIVGPARRGLWVLFGAVASVHLIACVNLMNFLLAQAERRKHEAAVRRALGASRGHLLSQSLTTATLVALLGGVVGTACAYAGLGVLVRNAPVDVPRLAEVRLDSGILVFSLGATLLTGLFFGAVPAWRLARSDPQDALRASPRGIAGGGQRWHGMLVATEVALSVVLLATAALFAGSFWRLAKVDQGFRADRAFTGELAIPLATYAQDSQRDAYYSRLLQRLSESPGIAAAAVVSQLPLQGETWVDRMTFVGDTRPDTEQPNVNIRFASADFFSALGISLRAGRTFDEADRARHAMVISESLARLLWPGRDAVGRQLTRGNGSTFEVVGVVGDTRTAANAEPVPVAYRPLWDWPARRANLVVRTVGDLSLAAGAVRAAIHATDRDVPAPTLRAMAEVLDDSVAPQRFQLLLTGVFAGAALLLTALGIYGVVAYTITRRRRELGVRVALGAQAGDLRRLVLLQGMQPVWLGIAVGVVLALGVGRLLAALLFETRPNDPIAFAMTLLVLAGVAVSACYIPAQRATRLNPTDALRAE